MGRTLSVSRATVTPDNEAEYLTTVRKLAVQLERRGQRLWIFRSSETPHTFIEFSESPSLLSHRVRASRTGEELKLEMQLQSIARYAPDAWDLWEEVGLEEAPRKSDGWKPGEHEEGQE
jgi:hypothetical protein